MSRKLEKPARISQDAWDAVDIPELTDAEFAGAQPFSKVFPDAFRDWMNRGGRPRAVEPKVRIGLRLAADVVSAMRAGGKNYNARVEAILRAAIQDGKL